MPPPRALTRRVSMRTNWPTTVLRWVCLSLIVLVVGGTRSARGDIVAVFFTGFLSPVPGSGMEALNNALADRFAADFPNLKYSGRAYEYTQQQQARDYILGFENIDRLFVGGHSFGASSAIQLAENFLAPLGIEIDLTFQIDSVYNGLGPPLDDALPANVKAGYNYFQISTGLFEPQGRMFVVGATNVNVEILFNDPTVTHTSIDDDPRLHNQIFHDMAGVIPEPASSIMIAVIGCWLVLVRTRSGRPQPGSALAPGFSVKTTN